MVTDITAIKRNRLFFNQYRYCLRLGLEEVSCMRGLPGLDKIDANLDFLLSWQVYHSAAIKRQKRKNLHGFRNHLAAATDPFKFVVSHWVAWIYSNDMNFLNSVVALPGVTIPEFSEAVITHATGTVLLKKSDYLRRTFLKRTWVTAEQKQTLKNFFSNHHSSIKLSGSFKQWMHGNSTRVYDYYFIDHCDDGLIVLMSLLHPGLARTTVDLVVDK